MSSPGQNKIGFYVLVFFGLCFLGGGGWLTFENARYQGVVVRTDATVIRVYTQAAGRHGHTNMVRYRYERNTGAQVDSTEVTSQLWSHLHVGDRLPIKYLPGEKAGSRIDSPAEDEFHRRGAMMLLLGGIGIWLVGGVIGLLASRDQSRQVQE